MAGSVLSRLAPLVRIAFWVAMVFAITMAVLPKPPHLGLEPLGDKVQHMIAFGVLALLAQTGFNGTPRWQIAERLSFLGAMIELVQSIPALHRDCDIKDWIADTVVVVIVTALFALRGVPRRRRR
ncbi:MAG: hypothetical protein ABIT04_13760 [Novosphingobium sp.]